jgi:hypothetical protein
MILVGNGEGEVLAIDCPFDVHHFGAIRQIERSRLPAVDAHQPGRGAAVAAMNGIEPRIDADAGQLVHGRGQLGKRGVEDRVG